MTGSFYFIESRIFTKTFLKIGTDEDLRRLQADLCKSPEKGNAIQGTGGLRKIRLAVGGKGKSGGARIIYYYMMIRKRIFLCFAYKKGRLDELSSDDRKVLKGILDQIKKEA